MELKHWRVEMQKDIQGVWAWRLASSKAKRKVIKKEPVDLPPAI